MGESGSDGSTVGKRITEVAPDAPQVTTVTSRWSLVVSGMPAYAGTAPTDETPGTISKPSPAFTQA